MGEVQTIAAPVPETDGELAARLRAYAVTIGPTMGVTVRFVDADLLRRVAAGLEGGQAARVTINEQYQTLNAQAQLIEAQKKALWQQRLWVAFFVVLCAASALVGLS